LVLAISGKEDAMSSYLFVSAILGALMLGRGMTASAQESVPQASTNDNAAPVVKENAPSGNSVVIEQQRWRYRWHNGRWWYWLPSQRWVYWSQDHWEDYLPPPPTPTAATPAQASVTVCRYPTTSYYDGYRASSYYGAWGYGAYRRGRYRR
jgi:hypothetical protein